MPISYRIDPARSLVLTTVTGVVTDNDVLAHKRALASDPEYHPSMKELSDVRGVTDLEVTAEGIAVMAGFDREHDDTERGHRIALVASADVVYGMARMYQMNTVEADERVGVFRTLDEATRWLGIDEDAAGNRTDRAGLP